MKVGKTEVEISQEDINNFYRKIIIQEDGCWDVDCAKDKDGYSRFSINKHNVGAHRFMYHIHHQDEDITGLEVCHTCDHPWCCCPEHLFADTHQVNVADCVQKNRQSKGSSLPQSVLTEQDVHDILNGIIDWTYTSVSQIANQYNTVVGTIRYLIYEKSWNHITKDYNMVNIRNLIINPTTKSGKLSPDDVRDIRKRLANGETGVSIAKVYKIDNTVVNRIKLGKIHKNII